MTYVNNLGDVGPDDVARAGGKAVGLGGLIKAGLPVPQGYVLNTAAYADYVTTNHLQADILALATLSPQAAPQVLGTGVATQRITSGQQIGVDGDAGTVTIQPYPDAPGGPPRNP